MERIARAARAALQATADAARADNADEWWQDTVGAMMRGLLARAAQQRGLGDPPVAGVVDGWVPDVPIADAWPGLVYESLLDLRAVASDGRIRLQARRHRQATGAVFTPLALAREVCARTLAPLARGSTVLDPAAGGGAFLLAALDVLAGDNAARRVDVAATQLAGMDCDLLAVEVARGCVWLASGGCVWAERIRQTDALTEEWPAADAVVGNPPYRFGKHRPGLSRSFTLANGQWDTYWLFVERALDTLRNGGRLGLLLPDAVLARHEPERVRRYLLERVDDLHVRHVGAAFGIGVSVAAVTATRGSGDGPFVFAGADGKQQQRMRLDELRRHAGAVWLPRAGRSDGALRLGDCVSISRGEETGKRDLLTIESDVPGTIPVLAGSGVEALLDQPAATHRLAEGAVRKPPANYAAPKVVAVKTGRTLRAALDRVGLVTLQSVYNIRVIDRRLTPAFVCALIASPAVNARFIEPVTVGKRLFPQITQRMIADIRFPLPDAGLVAEVTAAVESGNTDSAFAAIERLFA